jgi:Fe-Mn family superoxide dismutase
MENPRSAMTRREALKLMGAGAALAGMSGLAPRAHAAAGATTGPLGWDLPKLPYAYDALEPHIDARTMEIHLTKHHQAYINNAKKLLESHPDLLAKGPEALVKDLAVVPEAIRPGIRNNAGGHVNHAFFWAQLAPAGSTAIGEALAAAIARDLGSLDDFKKQFADAAMKRFGSGWAWLSVKGGKLIVHSTANQDSPLSDGLAPVLGLDVWEHAYYLHYQNRRADYVGAFWNVVNWQQAEANFLAATRG